MTTTLLAALLSLAPAPSSPIEIPLDAGRWIIGDENFKLDPADRQLRNGEIVDFLGRRAMRVSKGLFRARDVDFRDGTIDADIAFAANGVFFGVVFRAASADQYEVVFFRPGASGTTQAIQYTPGLLGANVWQLYTGPGSTASAEIRRERWIHVRIVVRGAEARLFLDGAAEPALIVPELRSGNARGSIGFWGHMGDAYFADIRYTPGPDAPSAARPDFLPGALTDWELSEIFDAERLDPSVFPTVGSLKWERVKAENPGMVVINRYRRSPNVLPPDRDERVRGLRTGGKFVLARTTIRSDRDEIRRLKLGYSDEVVVFLNGAPVYSGNNSLYFREPKFLGLLDGQGDSVYLPLRKGDNEVVLAVTEYFGGWGFQCLLEPPGGAAGQRRRRMAAEIAAAANPTGKVVANVTAALVQGLSKSRRHIAAWERALSTSAGVPPDSWARSIMQASYRSPYSGTNQK